MFSSIVIGIVFGVICVIGFPIVFSYWIISLLINIIIYYIINRFLFPKVLYSPGYLKAYFLGVALVVLIFELIGFLIMFQIGNYANYVNHFADEERIESYSPELLFAHNYLVEFNTYFIALILVKMIIFLLSRRILGFIFKKEYKAYEINDFIIPKQPPTKKVKYVGFALGVFFTLSNIDILPLMIGFKERDVLIPIFSLMQLVYQSFYIESF